MTKRYEVGETNGTYFVIDTEIEEGTPRILCVGPDFWTAIGIATQLNGFDTAALKFILQKQKELPKNVVHFTGNWHDNQN